MRNFDDDLRKELTDPESAAHFANAQAESAKELLKCGVINNLNETSLNNKTYRRRWNAKFQNTINRRGYGE